MNNVRKQGKWKRRGLGEITRRVGTVEEGEKGRNVLDLSED